MQKIMTNTSNMGNTSSLDLTKQSIMEFIYPNMHKLYILDKFSLITKIATSKRPKHSQYQNLTKRSSKIEFKTIIIVKIFNQSLHGSKKIGKKLNRKYN